MIGYETSLILIGRIDEVSAALFALGGEALIRPALPR
ncbi:hypothetical protein PEL8287_03147 [Roseovarius litorisediminis]|uniref:Uncharacterized protein n=1 Tax=Roseovarius litorisediminis TaxID=1312363 RepID=A0A1Y5T9U5_9RHOB|nr:hypothetical protein PEL8287_03147 [Roseovarius litorisediminis]